MTSLQFSAPGSVEEAIALLAADSNARALAGGTDLLVQMRSGRLAPSRIVDLKRIPGMTGIRKDAGGFVIGAATSCAALGEHAELCAAWPGVVEGANLIGSTQVQGRATAAGNLCNSSPAADSVPGLIAAGAVCVVAGPNGKREVAAEGIPTGPGRNSLAPGEFVVEIRLPARPERSGDAYLRAIPRTEMDIAVVGAAVNLVLASDGTIAEARVALGAVAPTALLVADAGAALVGSKLQEDALSRMDAAVTAACKPISDKRGTAQYRTSIAAVLARRAAKIAYERAGERR
jgi:carbon-monoxide dehydrogenase medium subunit